MDKTPMQKARESFLKKHFLDKNSLEVLNRAEDLSTLLIKVEAFDDNERGVFFYSPETNEFCLYEQNEFFVRSRNCFKTGKCHKNIWNTCLTRYSGEKVHPFERFLQMCSQPVYELIEITEKQE